MFKENFRLFKLSKIREQPQVGFNKSTHQHNHVLKTLRTKHQFAFLINDSQYNAL